MNDTLYYDDPLELSFSFMPPDVSLKSSVIYIYIISSLKWFLRTLTRYTQIDPINIKDALNNHTAYYFAI